MDVTGSAWDDSEMRTRAGLLSPPFLLILSAGLFLSGCGGERGPEVKSGEAAFRVRSDFAAPLNADRGWAGAANENVSVNADQPFRLRFEVERAAPPPGSGSFRLQVRRNQGEWTAVEAHDFPHPLRELDLEFSPADVGTAPKGWAVAQGNVAGLSVRADGEQTIVRAQATQDALMALYSPPWDSQEFAFATVLRVPAENASGVSLIFGFVDAANHGRVVLDTTAGVIRVSRLVKGAETVLAERPAALVAGQWLGLEIGYEEGILEVNFQDDTLEFTAKIGDDLPPSSLGFQIPANQAVDFREFVIEGTPRTPRVSIVACAAFESGAATTDLLAGSGAGFQAGAGMSLAERTPAWRGAGAHGEFEWALVVRRFADNAVTNEEGDVFEFRMVEATGSAVAGARNPELRLALPPGHVGGTFVETPGRIGPWQAANGDLYFIMEPAETSNLFMMIKSSDHGRTWREVDGANRPQTGDLESVDGRQVGDTIHIVHQVTRSTRYHAFRTSDHPTQPDTWAIRDEVGGRADSFAQAASLVVRPDGSLVIFHVGQAQLHANVRAPSGSWSPDTIVDVESASAHAILGANDVIHLAYYGLDGTLSYRRMAPDGTLTPKTTLATGAGTSRPVYGAVLPLVFDPGTNTLFIVYQLANGELWERRVVNEGPLTPAVRVTDRNVITNAVDSQQPAADVVLDRGALHVLFIEQSSRSLFSTQNRGGWQAPVLQVENIQGSWVRGNVYTRPDGVRVYGYVYDAGSEGGAGMNRFSELELNGRM